MTTSALIITVSLLGIIIWFVNGYLPTPGRTKKIISAVVTLCVTIWVLQAYGVLPSLSHISHLAAGNSSGQFAQAK